MSSNPDPSRPPKKHNKKTTSNLRNTYGRIDTSSVDSQLWMTRIPSNLANFWDEVPEGTLLGTLTFTKGTAAPKRGIPGPRLKPPQKNIQQKLTLEVSEELVQSKMCNENAKLAEIVKDLPLDYIVTNLTTKIPTLHPFTRKDDGSIQVHGSVNRSCNLQMERTKRYRDLCNTRMAEAEEKLYVKSMDEQTEKTLLTGLNKTVGVISSGFGLSIAECGKKINEAKQDMLTPALYDSKKRKFTETQSIRSILFELFSQQRHWAMKELRGLISGGRSEKEIRAELQKIADYHKTGEYKGFWELKKEFHR